MVRAATRNALREYFSETDDPTQEERVRMEGEVPVQDPQRILRLLARALREQQQEIDALTARVTALENQ